MKGKGKRKSVCRRRAGHIAKGSREGDEKMA